MRSCSPPSGLGREISGQACHGDGPVLRVTRGRQHQRRLLGEGADIEPLEAGAVRVHPVARGDAVAVRGVTDQPGPERPQVQEPPEVKARLARIGMAVEQPVTFTILASSVGLPEGRRERMVKS